MRFDPVRKFFVGFPYTNIKHFRCALTEKPLWRFIYMYNDTNRFCQQLLKDITFPFAFKKGSNFIWVITPCNVHFRVVIRDVLPLVKPFRLSICFVSANVLQSSFFTLRSRTTYICKLEIYKFISIVRVPRRL